MNNQNKISLLEATQMALLGKLNLEESKKAKQESINVSTDDSGNTYVETDDATVMIQEKQDELPKEEECPECTDVIEVPVEGDETIIPEEVVEPEVVEEITDEVVEPEVVEEACQKLEETDDMANVIAEIEKQYGRKLTAEEIRLVKTVGPLMSVDVEEANEEGINNEMSDEDIVKYITDNFFDITGKNISEVYNKGAEDDDTIFNQEVIDNTSESIFKLLDDAGVEKSRLDDIVEKLDDALVKMYNTEKTSPDDTDDANQEYVAESKEIKTESIDGEEATEKIQEIYEDYCKQGMEYNFWDDLIRTTSIKLDEIENWYKASFEESKKPCKESKEIKTEDLDANQFSFKFTDETQFGSLSNDDALSTLNELQQYFQKYADVIKADTLNEYIDNDHDMQAVAATLNQAIEILNKAWLEESKKVEDKSNVNLDSFSKALTEYLNKNNEGNVLTVSKVTPDDKVLTVEGKLTTADGIEKNVKFEFNTIKSGKSMTKYGLIETTNLNENKYTTSLITQTTKEGIIECHNICKIN